MKWCVAVERLGKNRYRTRFEVGVQGFELAHSTDDEEAEEYCLFIQRMFLQALKNLGVSVTPANEVYRARPKYKRVKRK